MAFNPMPIPLNPSIVPPWLPRMFGSLGPIPPLPPMPPPPVPPGGSIPDSFDLSSVDNGTEAMVMPGVDLLTDMMIAASPSRKGRVTVESGNQKLEYVIHHNVCSKTIGGRINGQDFVASMNQTPGTTYIQGMTPSGPLGETISYYPGSATAVGKVGSVEFNQSFSQDPTYGYSGHYGMLSGTMGGKGFGVDINRKADGNGFDLNGYVGDKGLQGSIINVSPNTYRIERNIGGTLIRQTLQLG